jgi:hypothetical protein
MPYPTIDSIPDLTVNEMILARALSWETYVGPIDSRDFQALVSGSDQSAALHQVYKVDLKAGATYDILSLSYLDPSALAVYDQAGNAIATNVEADDPASWWLGDGFYAVDAIWQFVAVSAGSYYISAGWKQAVDHPVYLLSLFEDVDTIPTGLILSGSNAGEWLQGSRAADVILGFGGNDTIVTNGGSDHVDGGSGIDTVVLPGVTAGYTISRIGSSATLYGYDATVSLEGVERMVIGSDRFAIDVEGHGGQAYRLYQAAFDRAPDLGGLGFQMRVLDDGWSLTSVAANFIASPEFQHTYGALNNTQFVTQLYANVLHRVPDDAGLAYHLDRLAHGVAREAILVGFSESPENQANVLGAIDHGMQYL